MRGQSKAARLVLLFGLATCHAVPSVETPPAAPAFSSPAAVIPADLDVVVRVHLARLRVMHGTQLLALVKARVLEAGADRPVQQWVTEALTQTDTIWLGFRPASEGDALDNALVLRGRFDDLELPPKGFSRKMDLGGGWLRFDRLEPVARSEPARLYFRPNSVLVLVSEAEIDAVERTLERGETGHELEAPSSGMLSVAARLHRLAPALRRRAPAAARLLTDARRLEMEVTLDRAKLNAKAEVRFVDERRAKRAADAMAIFVDMVARDAPTVAAARDFLSIETVGSEVLVRLEIPGEKLNELLACVKGGCG